MRVFNLRAEAGHVDRYYRRRYHLDISVFCGVTLLRFSFLHYLSGALLALLAAVPALAHPTFIVDTRVSLSVGEEQRLSEIHLVWVFDDVYSATLSTFYNRDPEGDPVLSDAERAELVAMHTTSLEDFGWFAKLVAGEQEISFLPPEDFGAEFEDSRFALDFTLRPDPDLTVDANAIMLKVFDPSFVVAFLVQPADISFSGPENCILETEAGTGTFRADALSGMNVSPQEGATIAESMAPPIRVRCT